MSIPRFFNTEGPIIPSRHYCIDPLKRLDLPVIEELIDQWKYFVLHAPRQTGKTSCLRSLVEKLTSEGKYRVCYVNVEGAQFARDDAEAAFKRIVGEVAERAAKAGEPRLRAFVEPILAGYRPAVGGFSELLTHWTELDSKPLVLLIDEVDALVGDTLVALLRTLRAGYDMRPGAFPASVVLCGVRDVRDYRMASSSDKAIITGGSAFNIKARSLRLGDFSRREVEELLHQHTSETGQAFTDTAMDAIWERTQGQPWLVNALAYQACSRDPRGKDRSRPIDLESVEEAKEALVARRDTHLDQLAERLREDRVRRVVQPILAGGPLAGLQPDDLQYCIDLGLIRQTERGPDIANSIYREIVPRELTADTQDSFKVQFAPDWVRADGTLDVAHLLAEFQDFYRENGEAWAQRLSYQEAGPQLLLQAFLQRVVNGKGRVAREYALGTSRTDLYLRWPHPGGTEKVVIELKVLHKSLKATIAEGAAQVSAYAERCGADEAHLLIFDRKAKGRAERRVFRREETFLGRRITIWGM